MKFKLIFLIVLIFPGFAFAQKQAKPKLLVYGNDFVSWSAAVQAAKSNVPTVLIMEHADFVFDMVKQNVKIDSRSQLDGGLWMDLLMDMAISKTRSDSLARTVKNDFNPRLAQNNVNKLRGSLSNLTVIYGQKIEKCEQKGKKWQVTLSNRVRYTIPVVVDASADGQVFSQAKFKESPESLQKIKLIDIESLSLPESRTTIAVQELDEKVKVLTLENLLAAERENFFTLGAENGLDSTPRSIPMRMAIGQALGATAAYCAFFATQTKSIDVRKLQAELLTYNARLNPYVDVKNEDEHFDAIQKFYLTGVFLTSIESGEMYFDKDAPVEFDDLKIVMNDLYSRSQLWFLDNYRDDDLKWQDLLSLVKFVSLKGDEIRQQLIKDWSSKRKFKGEFDPEAVVTREQLAVVLNLYSSAFSKAVNFDGTFKK